jgi:hypothetical protein
MLQKRTSYEWQQARIGLNGMRLRRALTVLLLVFSFDAHAVDDTPTQLMPPQGAKDIRNVTFNDRHAVQMNFKLYPKFPENPALDHYLKQFDGDWSSCSWGGKWDHFIDGRQKPEVTIHQWMHIWVNEKKRRAVVLVSQYKSEGVCPADRPNNDEQLVSIIEYIDIDPSEMVTTLKASCEARTGVMVKPAAR